MKERPFPPCPRGALLSLMHRDGNNKAHLGAYFVAEEGLQAGGRRVVPPQGGESPGGPSERLFDTNMKSAQPSLLLLERDYCHKKRSSLLTPEGQHGIQEAQPSVPSPGRAEQTRSLFFTKELSALQHFRGRMFTRHHRDAS